MTVGGERAREMEKEVRLRDLEKGLANLAQVAENMGQKVRARDLAVVDKGRRELVRGREKARGSRHSNIRECGMTSQ